VESDFDPIYFYDEVARIYDRDTHPEILDPNSAYHRGFSSLINTLDPKSILEIGCGTGKRIKALVAYYDSIDKPLPQIIGTDPSAKMLSHIPDAVRARVTLLNTDNTQNLADKSFDLTLTSGVLCSVNLESAISICSECLRITNSFIVHVDTPKDAPHLNDLDFLEYFTKSGLKLIYWNTIYPHPIDKDAEHQIILKTTGENYLPSKFPIRHKKAKYDQAWDTLLQDRLKR
jgi:SAM-dependent methyltransferase